MKKRILRLFVLGLVVTALTSCNFIFSLILDADLTVENIQVLESGGEITGFRITFGNYGGGEEDVPFAIVLSDDTTVSPTAGDYIIYEGFFDIDWNDTVQIDVSASQILTYLQNNNGVPSGEFYVGVFVDHTNAIDEGDDTDNELTTGQTYFFGGGGDYDWEALYEPINTYNVPIAQNVESYGRRFYKFTPAFTGYHEIWVQTIAPGGDMGFILLDDPNLDLPSILLEVNDYSDNTTETGGLTLTGGATYYLVVDEWADPGFVIGFSLVIYNT